MEKSASDHFVSIILKKTFRFIASGLEAVEVLCIDIIPRSISYASMPQTLPLLLVLRTSPFLCYGLGKSWSFLVFYYSF